MHPKPLESFLLLSHLQISNAAKKAWKNVEITAPFFKISSYPHC